MPLLSISQVEKSYHNKLLIDNISFSINEGDRLALIGLNGTGKTTLFKMIQGQVKPDLGKIIHHGQVMTGFLSQTLEDQTAFDSPLKTPELVNAEQQMKQLEHILVDTQRSDYSQKLKEYESAISKYEALGGYDFEQRMLEILGGLGLNLDDLNRPILSLSGGERMRVSLAKLIVQKPDVLLLDEPTNHLDASAMEWLEEYLQKYTGAVCIISHDRYFIDRTCNKIMELENGKIKIYPGNYSHYILQKAAFLESQRQVVEQLEKEVKRQMQVTQTLLSHRKMVSYHSREKTVFKLSEQLNREKAKLKTAHTGLHFTLDQTATVKDPNRVLIEIKNLSMSFDQKNFLIKDFSFYLKAQDKVVLLGPNGCGKTTFLNILLGKTDNFSGQILISGQARFGYMGQFIPFSNEDSQILEEIMSRTDLNETNARNLLAGFGFRDIDVYKQIKVLSGGERSRLYLCTLLEEKPDLLFLDEPTNHLDIASREILEKALQDYQGAIIAVSHDRYFIEKTAKFLLGFHEGRLREYVSLSQYHQQNKETSKLSKASLDPSNKNPIQDKISRNIQEKGTTPNINKAKIRREVANLKEKSKSMEKEILLLEAEKKMMEESFSATTLPETYHLYAELEQKLAQFFDEFLEINELLDTYSATE